MSEPRLSRRAFLATAAAAALGGCGAGAAARPGSTLVRTLADPDGNGLLAAAGAVPLRDRTELAPAARTERVLATLAQLSDLHVRDAQSPARVAFLDRLGPRVGSAFRWHETLTAQVVAAAVASVSAAGPDAAVITGDLVDSAQRNELAWALALLRGGPLRPDSGARGYEGVQAASNPDPLYYRPDVDAPRHPGLLDRAAAPLRSPGLRVPWHAVLGNHDILVQGELAPTPAIRAVATGRRLLVTPDPDFVGSLAGRRLTRAGVDRLLREGLPGEAIDVAPDRARAHASAAEVVAALGGRGSRLDYVAHVGDDLRVIVLDLVRRDAGGDGLVTPATLAFLQESLAAAGARHVIVCCHQPLDDTAGGEAILAVLDADPRVAAVVCGHLHRNAIDPRRTAAGGYWLITTASIVDWPQQWRALRLVRTRGGAAAIETWLVDHGGRPGDDGDLAGVARDLAFLDPQGGRPAGAAGPAEARNVRLHLPRRVLRAPARPARPVLPAAPPPSTLGYGAGDVLSRG